MSAQRHSDEEHSDYFLGCAIDWYSEATKAHRRDLLDAANVEQKALLGIASALISVAIDLSLIHHMMPERVERDRMGEP